MRLDPRSPYVVNTHELGRRPGSMRALHLTVPATSQLGGDLVRVAAGSSVELDFRLEAVMEGVLATGQAYATVTGECARCLDPLEDQLTVDFQELYVYPESDAEEDEASRLDGELLDLEPVVRDTVVLALPFQPVCEPDCQGLCLECGVRLSEVPGHAHADDLDPRWAALTALTTDARGDRAGEDEKE